MDLDKGGRGAIERMVEAYGFTTRQALSEKLGVSKSTLATRYMRDSFPSDWVIQCALETGASLRWITTGEGVIFENSRTDIVAIRKKKIIDGKIFDAGFLIFDKTFIPKNMLNTVAIVDDGNIYISETSFENVKNGLWVVDIEQTISVKEIIRIPGGKIRILDEKTTIECEVADVGFLAHVFLSCTMRNG
ncbi:phage repressor protein CI [Ewingella sp. AOP8-B2-18]